MARDIREWLENLGLGKYVEAFAENEIDFDVLPHLGEADLKELGLPLGPRKKLLATIAELHLPEPASIPIDAHTREAERRQLTVMFVDLVGSTELSGRLDPEDMRDVMRRYQDAVAGAVTRYGGHVAKYLGDGVLAYFGWPRAHEDQAERAVRAGLDATLAVGSLKLEGSNGLSARAGIATGEVVIGDLVGEVGRETGAVTGETPNLAARLQGIGKPGHIVVSDITRRLIGETFELYDLGAHELKGFTEPVPAWRVVGESPAECRFESGYTERLMPVVGREHEIALLLDRWHQARCGEGQVVLLSGEAGIGKSRIAQTTRERVAQEPHTRLRYQCAPYFRSTALYPFVRQMELAAGFTSEDDTEAKLDKIENLLARSTEAMTEVAPLIATILSVPTGDRYPPVKFTSQRWREKTLEALTDQLLGLAARQPVFVIFEDAQWADPTTLDTLEQMIDGLQRSAVLLVITFRPDFEPPWRGHTHVTTLTLNRLTRDQCAAMVDICAGGKTLPSEVLHQIVARTDGVPLFVEELTKTVLESGLLREAGDRFALCGPLPPMAIPSTLRDSLMARLDRVPAAREVAQEAAVIGREFSYGLLAAILAMGEDRLRDILEQLVEFELIFCRGTPPHATYTFKHTLVQEAAYESLLKAKREMLHDRIATALQRRFPSVAETHPEILAHHYTRSGKIETAIPCWRSAGERASERAADREAIEHFGKALQLIKNMPEGSREEQELELCLALGPALMNAEGTASEDVRRAYSRAKDLAERAQRHHARFTALWGLWLNSVVGGRLDVAQSLATETLTVAEELADPDCLLQAHHAGWTTSMYEGDLAATRYHAERGSDLYDVERHRSHAYKYGGHDPGICAASDGAVALWMLGHPDRAIERVGEAIRIADQISHAHSTAQAYCYAAIVRLLRGEPGKALAYSEKLKTHSETLELKLWAANAKVLRGWALASQGRTADGLVEFQDGVEQRDELGATPRQSLYLASLALAYRDVGCVQKAQRAIDRALEAVDQVWDPYVHWAHGMVSSAEQKDTETEAAFETALQLAREKSARSWELRAATSLARLWRNQGKLEEARGLLAPSYRWFNEGFTTQDLNDAKALLDELS